MEVSRRTFLLSAAATAVVGSAGVPLLLGDTSAFAAGDPAGTSILTTDLAWNQPTSASSYLQGHAPANAVDGNTNTYWESTDNDFPQWLQVDLGSAIAIGSITLTLPTSSAWTARTQTLSILGSTNNSSFSTIVASAGYPFNPSTGSTVTVTLPSGTTTRYVRLNFTANTGGPAAQISEFEVYAA
jgi:hypothetical protein